MVCSNNEDLNVDRKDERKNIVAVHFLYEVGGGFLPLQITRFEPVAQVENTLNSAEARAAIGV